MARKKKPEDQPQENEDQNSGNDDTFGLPEIEYEPVKRTPEAPRAETPATPEPEERRPDYTTENTVTRTTMERDETQPNDYAPSSYYDEDEERSPWPKILGIAAVLIIAGAAIWYFGFHRPEQVAAEKAKAAQEEQARADSARAEEDRLAAQRLQAEADQRRTDSLANAAPAAGTIETLSERTGRYYVVVASAIDGDLLMDYARKLGDKGVSVKIIPPYGNVKFHRLTVAEGDTFSATQQLADGLKSEYNEGAWVIKY